MENRDQLLKIFLDSYGLSPVAVFRGATAWAKAVVCDPETPSDVLTALARCSTSDLLERIGENSNASAELLAQLAVNESPEVRVAVGSNPNTASETVWMLASDGHPDVRYSLAENHNLDPSVLEALARDQNPYVACRAARTLCRLRPPVGFTAKVRRWFWKKSLTRKAG